MVDTPNMVTLTEAAKRWDVSVRTLRRRIAAGELPEAQRINTRAGQTWHVPVAALTRLGYQPSIDAPIDDTPSRVDNDMVLVKLTEIMDRQQLALDAATNAEKSATLEAAELRAQLVAADELRTMERDHLTRERDALAARVTELETTTKRRWFRR